MKLAIAASGGLGTICLKHILKSRDIGLILTDGRSTEIQAIARQKDISLFVGNPRDGRLLDFIGTQNFELLLSINYLFLFDSESMKNFNLGINFHGSLLPKYRGRTPHVWSIINNEKVAGVTAHQIDLDCDTGPIALQHEIQITSHMTGGQLLAAYHEVYPEMIDRVLDAYSTNSLSFVEQDEEKATFYGKRTPESGLINWDWSKERIHNWVRAQAYPYPGAFSFYENQKVIIDAVEYSDLGYHFEVPNGQIIGFDDRKPIVKSTNGALKLTQIRTENNFQHGSKFNND
ncbi:MAG: methionyl-tRNA formyltransferase [Flavobacteriales bacterium]|nr:methionyl-tRNA formyltransferase [Flavobacteriales bacterium]